MTLILCGIVTSAFSAQLSVRGNLDIYGIWSANLLDFDSDVGAGKTTRPAALAHLLRFRRHENLRRFWGWKSTRVGREGSTADWGTDGKGNIEVKHAYLNFTFPDTTVNVQAGLQYVAMPSVFGNPVFDDDAAALTVSLPIYEAMGVTLGYTRGSDTSHQYR